MVKNQMLNLFDYEQDLETLVLNFDMLELMEILMHLMSHQIYLGQNKELLIENMLK
jgi:hypothetical protein